MTALIANINTQSYDNSMVKILILLVFSALIITAIIQDFSSKSTKPSDEISAVPERIDSTHETSDNLFKSTQQPVVEELDSPTETNPILETTGYTFDYLALGDSLAVGIGAKIPANDGYVPRLRLLLEANLGPEQDLNLINLAVSGETTHSMIINGQLDDAIAEVATGSTDLITLDIGANDFLDLGRSKKFSGCFPDLNLSVCFTLFQEAIENFESNLDSILALLRKEAGSETTIALMTYYNPIHSGMSQLDYWPKKCLSTISTANKNALTWLEYNLSNSTISNLLVNSDLSGISYLGLEGIPGTPMSEGLNDIIRRVATDHEAIVADLQPSSGSLLGPDDVSLDCIHPDNSGHQEIANAFSDTILQ